MVNFNRLKPCPKDIRLENQRPATKTAPPTQPPAIPSASDIELVEEDNAVFSNSTSNRNTWGRPANLVNASTEPTKSKTSTSALWGGRVLLTCGRVLQMRGSGVVMEINV